MSTAIDVLFLATLLVVFAIATIELTEKVKMIINVRRAKKNLSKTLDEFAKRLDEIIQDEAKKEKANSEEKAEEKTTSRKNNKSNKKED